MEAILHFRRVVYGDAGRAVRGILAALMLVSVSGGAAAQGAASVAENAADARLKEKAESLQSQVELLTKALAAARAEADDLRAELNLSRFEPGAPAAMTGQDLTVLDVNRALKMVIVSGGARQGMKPGMKFMAVRKDKGIASVRIVDVRKMLSGAVVEKLESGAYPERNDRLVMMGSQE